MWIRREIPTFRRPQKDGATVPARAESPGNTRGPYPARRGIPGSPRPPLARERRRRPEERSPGRDGSANRSSSAERICSNDAYEAVGGGLAPVPQLLCFEGPVLLDELYPHPDQRGHRRRRDSQEEDRRVPGRVPAGPHPCHDQPARPLLYPDRGGGSIELLSRVCQACVKRRTDRPISISGSSPLPFRRAGSSP